MMDNISHTSSMTHFLLLQFSEVRDLQIVHFLIFLTLYMATVTGNLLIFFSIVFDHHLHTPMYFFLMNLAVMDIGSISAVMPKSMVNSILNTSLISYPGCVAQAFFLLFFAGSDFALLTLMAHDRYVAICNPLRYETIMNKVACVQMVACVWISGFLYGVIHTASTFAIPFCSNVLKQYYCENYQLLKLSCSDLYLVEVSAIVVSVSIILGCFVFITITYVQIFSTVLRMPSAQGRQKAFSTCLPHLIVVSAFVFTVFLAFVIPTSDSQTTLGLAFAVIYSVVTPMMNPLIYSLRNKEIKVALWKMLNLNDSSKASFSNFHR